MTAAPGTPRNTVALFAGASRNSERVIVPINDAALNKDGPLPAFYCVHSISGTVRADFQDLARYMEPSVRFYGIQAPAKKILDGEFGDSIIGIANHYAKALIEFQPQGPLLVGGYCAGAVVALEMARILRARGREVGPLMAIDGAPENSNATLGLWSPRYWYDVLRNLPGWMVHGDLMRHSTFRSWSRSALKNLFSLVKAAFGLKRGQQLGGSFAMDSLMDLSAYSPAHRSFINRFYSAIFAYHAASYSHEIVVYNARITPLLYLPQYERVWRKFAPHAEVVRIVGTHIAMMHEPYVRKLADDLRSRIATLASGHRALPS